jgi:hypothetical protein
MARFNGMEFADQETTFPSPFGDIHTRVTGAALKVLWGEGVGPQEAQGLIDANREMFTLIAQQKVEAGEADGGLVVITDLDVEDGLDADEPVDDDSDLL